MTGTGKQDREKDRGKDRETSVCVAGTERRSLRVQARVESTQSLGEHGVTGP